MDKYICKKVLEHKQQFIPHLFTVKQIKLLEKYLTQKKLTNTEKTNLYSTLKKKIEALGILKEEYYVRGIEMIPERVERAKEILKELNYENAFISGSFLFKRDYGDIDIYVIGRTRKQYHLGKRQFIFITEKELKTPLFFSAAVYSVSTFPVKVKPIIKKVKISEIMFTYQVSINEILDNDDQKTLRHLLFYYYLYVKKKIVDSHALYISWKELLILPRKERIQKINQLTQEILCALYSSRYLYIGASKFQHTTTKLMKEYSTNNLPIYNNFAQEVKNECRRAEI